MTKYLLALTVFLALAVRVEGFRRPMAPASRNTHQLAVNTIWRDHHSPTTARTTTSSRIVADSTTTSLRVAQRHHYAHNHNTQKFKNFEEVLATYHEEPLMVMFTAVNCGPCKLMKQELKQVKAMVDGKFRMFAVDTEKFPHIGSRFDVRALPCLLLVHNGEALLRIEGVLKAEEVVERVRTIL